MKHLSLVCALILALALLCGCSAGSSSSQPSAEPQTSGSASDSLAEGVALMRGFCIQVLDENGQPVVNASVTREDIPEDMLAIAGHTDAEGKAYFSEALGDVFFCDTEYVFVVKVRDLGLDEDLVQSFSHTFIKTVPDVDAVFRLSFAMPEFPEDKPGVALTFLDVGGAPLANRYIIMETPDAQHWDIGGEAGGAQEQHTTFEGFTNANGVIHFYGLSDDTYRATVWSSRRPGSVDEIYGRVDLDYDSSMGNLHKTLTVKR